MLSKYTSELNKYRHGLGPVVQSVADALGLPQIRGTWFYVDPKNGVNTNSGLTIAQAVADLQTAYGLCTSNEGDGIVVLASDADTTANTTSYLKAPLVWAKNSITVFGAGSPVKMFQRTRVSNKVVTTGSITTLAFVQGAAPVKDKIIRTSGSFITDGFEAGMYIRVNTTGNGADGTGFQISAVTAGVLTLTSSDTLVTETAANAGASVVSSYNTDLLSVTGHNNVFLNLHLYHGGADALELTCLKVTGNRNFFGNVHAAMGLGSAATQTTRSLWLNAGQENTFVSCTFGTDTVDHGNNATYDILIQGAVARNRFIDCETIRHVSAGVAAFAVYFNATTGGRPTVFDGCRFTCWSTAGGNANQSYCFGSTGACDDVWLTGNSCHPGYAALGMSGVAWIQGANVASGVAGVLTTT